MKIPHRSWNAFVVMAVMLWLAGCRWQRMYADYTAASLDYGDLSQGAYSKLIRGLSGEQDASGSLVVPQACWEGGTDASNACQAARNRIIVDWVSASDALCAEHVKTIFGNEASFNIAAGTLTNVLAGAATVVGGAVAKSALSAGAFLANSERSLVNETVYKSVLVPAVVKKIRMLREDSRKQIVSRLKDGVPDYSIHEAILDVVAYHQSCSFMHGLQKALEEGTLSIIGTPLAPDTRQTPTPTPAFTPTPNPTVPLSPPDSESEPTPPQPPNL